MGKQSFTSQDVFAMREQCGFGLAECMRALEKLDGDMDLAIKYLMLKGDCVCRRHKDGTCWTDEDYIKAIKQNRKTQENT